MNGKHQAEQQQLLGSGIVLRELVGLLNPYPTKPHNSLHKPTKFSTILRTLARSCGTTAKPDKDPVAKVRITLDDLGVGTIRLFFPLKLMVAPAVKTE